MMTTKKNHNFTAAMTSTASRSAMGSFCESSAMTNSTMNIVLFLDAAIILAASILFILISRMIMAASYFPNVWIPA